MDKLQTNKSLCLWCGLHKVFHTKDGWLIHSKQVMERLQN